MAITVFFDVRSTSKQYDQTMRDLEAAGQSAPAGRLFHVAQAEGERFQVVDVWESPQAFEKFAGTLLPILAKNGIEGGPPRVVPTHNIVRG
jgi:hypothetical protein